MQLETTVQGERHGTITTLRVELLGGFAVARDGISVPDFAWQRRKRATADQAAGDGTEPCPPSRTDHRHLLAERGRRFGSQQPGEGSARGPTGGRARAAGEGRVLVSERARRPRCAQPRSRVGRRRRVPARCPCSRCDWGPSRRSTLRCGPTRAHFCPRISTRTGRRIKRR